MILVEEVEHFPAGGYFADSACSGAYDAIERQPKRLPAADCPN